MLLIVQQPKRRKRKRKRKKEKEKKKKETRLCEKEREKGGREGGKEKVRGKRDSHWD